MTTTTTTTTHLCEEVGSQEGALLLVHGTVRVEVFRQFRERRGECPRGVNDVADSPQYHGHFLPFLLDVVGVFTYLAVALSRLHERL